MFPKKLRRVCINTVWLCPLLVFSLLVVHHDMVSTRHQPDTIITGHTDRTDDKVLATVTKQSDTRRLSNISYTSACLTNTSYVFIKIHKSGSTTLIAPFQKFAYLNNLYMTVPSMDHNNQLGWPYRFSPQNNLVKAPPGQKFEALVNHVVYNRAIMHEIMDPKSVYITVVREPKSHLLSAYNYFGVNFRIGNGPPAFAKFLSDPKRFDDVPDWLKNLGSNEGKTHIRSLTRNLQSADLGLEYENFDNQQAIDTFVSEIERDFGFILVLERLSESLVLMKRKLCWSMQDIVRINKNHHGPSWGYQNLSSEAAQQAYMWVNADSQLYDMAVKKLDNLRIGELDLDEEITVYESITSRISEYCWSMDRWNTTALTNPAPLVIQSTPYNEQFTVQRKFCVMLLLREEDFTFIFKCKQNPNHRQCKKQMLDLHHLYSLLNS